MKSLRYILASFDTLYHFTHGRNLVNILKKDEFILSDTDDYNPEGWKYYMSLTRMPYAQTGYPIMTWEDDVVRLVIDARALFSRYKRITIDTIKGKTVFPESDPYYNGNVEAEERLLSNQKIIKKFHKYIKRIDINTNTIKAKDADDIIQYADKLKIPVEVYDDDRLFNTAK